MFPPYRTFALTSLSILTLAVASGCGSGGALSAALTLPTSLSMTPALPVLAPGETAQLRLTATFKDGTTTDVTSAATWMSVDAGITQISAQGQLGCMGSGKGQIVASDRGITTSTLVTCTAGQITITGAKQQSLVGEVDQLQATAAFTNGTVVDVTSSATWSSSAPLVATVDTHGMMICVAAGTSQISAAHSGDTQAVVAVSCGTPVVSISPGPFSAVVGKPISLSASAVVGTAAATDITSLSSWSSNSPILSHLQGSTFVCASPGATTVTVSYASGIASVPAVCIPPSLHTPSYFLEASDEFVGPFPSWVNVKTAYGAVGDGNVDDTKAIQNALDHIGGYMTGSQVLWFPHGTYKISAQLTVTHAGFFGIVGEDPGNTTLKWAGLAGGTMLQTDGATYFRISRLTFDGSGLADTAEDLTSITPGGNYSGFNEVSDQRIVGVAEGIRLGIDAETTIERVLFDHITTNGVVLEDYNTLDIFINDSLFLGCSTGVSNDPPTGPNGGNFIVTNSFFDHSTKAHMSIGPTGYFTARHNTSTSSNRFFYAAGAGGNVAVITLQNNTILDPLDTPVQIGNIGPLLMIDNVFRMQSETMPTVIGNFDVPSPTDIFSMGNTYSNAMPPVIHYGESDGGAPLPFNGRLVTYDDIIANPSDIPDVAPPTSVYIPPNYARAIFEIPHAATSAQVQSVIDAAAASHKTRPVVHFSSGFYQLDQTIIVPAGSDLQIIGDETVTSKLQWFGAASQPTFKVLSSDVTFKNLTMDGGGPNYGGDGILISIPDQPGNGLIIDQAQLQTDNDTSMNFEGLEHLNAELFSFYSSGATTGINVTGGAFRNAKESTVGITNNYSGAMQSRGAGTSFNVSNGGKYMVQDNWHDFGSTSAHNFVLVGSGTVTEQTGLVAMNSREPFVIDNFDGNVSLIGLSFFGSVSLGSGPGKTNLLMLGMDGNDSGTYLPQSTNSVTATNILDSYNAGHIAEQELGTPQIVRTMLAQSRTEYATARLPLSASGHRIRMSRVSIGDKANAAIHVASATTTPGLYYTFDSAGGTLISSGGASPCATVASVSGNGNTPGWTLIAAGDGDYNVVSLGTVQRLESEATASGILSAGLGTSDPSFRQRWLVRPVGDGRYYVINRFDGSLLTSDIASNGCAKMGIDPSVDSTKWLMTAH